MIAACLFLILAANAEVLETTEDPTQTQNVTTLYPVPNKTEPYTTKCKNESEHTIKLKSKTDATNWKLEAAFGETNLDKERDGNIPIAEEGTRGNKSSAVFKPSQTLGSFVDDEAPPTALSAPFTPVFKQPAASFVSFPKQHSTFPKHLPSTHEQPPKEVHQRPQIFPDFPYKFENAIYTKAKVNWSDLESKPTAEVPVIVPAIYGPPTDHTYPGLDGNPFQFPDDGSIETHHPYNGNVNTYGFENYGSAEVLKYPGIYGNPGLAAAKPSGYGVPSGVPAGGLYKLTDPFKEKPAVTSPGEYGWDHHGEVLESHVKKRVNPLKDLLHLITAFLPVGLIISALTPSVINIQDTGNQQASNPYRRADTVPDVPYISERCRRRLLCELHADSNYGPPQKGKRKHCYKIYCEDTQALWRLLHWLLRHKADDHRGRSIT